MKLGGVGRALKPGVSEGRDNDPQEVSGGLGSAPDLVAIQGGADVEEDQGEDEADGGDSVAQPPPQVLLDVDEAQRREEGAGEGAEHPPVEEGGLELLLEGVQVVELVRAERRDVWLRAARADADYVEGCVEECDLSRGGFVAHSVFTSRLQQLDGNRHCQKDHPLLQKKKTFFGGQILIFKYNNTKDNYDVY